MWRVPQWQERSWVNESIIGQNGVKVCRNSKMSRSLSDLARVCNFHYNETSTRFEFRLYWVMLFGLFGLLLKETQETRYLRYSGHHFRSCSENGNQYDVTNVLETTRLQMGPLLGRFSIVINSKLFHSLKYLACLLEVQKIEVIDCILSHR